MTRFFRISITFAKVPKAHGIMYDPSFYQEKELPSPIGNVLYENTGCIKNRILTACNNRFIFSSHFFHIGLAI